MCVSRADPRRETESRVSSAGDRGGRCATQTRFWRVRPRGIFGQIGECPIRRRSMVVAKSHSHHAITPTEFEEKNDDSRTLRSAARALEPSLAREIARARSEEEEEEEKSPHRGVVESGRKRGSGTCDTSRNRPGVRSAARLSSHTQERKRERERERGARSYVRWFFSLARSLSSERAALSVARRANRAARARAPGFYRAFAVSESNVSRSCFAGRARRRS